jgi:hypothetical protein
MKTCLALLLVLLPVAATYAAGNDTPAESHDKVAPTPAKILAGQVGEIADSPTLTPTEKDDQILAAVRNAVIAATAHLTDPVEILKVTLELTTAAARSAPQFTHAIIDAVSTISAITAIDGAVSQLQAAVIDAATKAAAAAFESTTPKPPGQKFGGQYTDVIVSPSH